MAGVLPPNVSYFMQRLQGVSTSHFKVFPQSGDSGSAGKIIRFELPSNSYVNMRSLRFMFNVTLTGGGGRIPNDVASFIERVSIYAGGVLVQNGFQGYNVLTHAKASLLGSKCNPTLGHPEICRLVSSHNKSALTATPSGGTLGLVAESYTSSDVALCIDNWEGLLGSIEPSIIDTGLLPQITLEIQLADDAVCPCADLADLSIDDFASGAAPGTANLSTTYSLSNLALHCEVIGMATSVLDQIVEQRIASVGYLSLPFKNYFTTIASHNDTSRFNVNSASWDKLWITYRDSTYATQKQPIRVSGHKKSGAFVDDAAGQTTADIDIGIPDYDIGGSAVFDNNNEKYLSGYFNFSEKSPTTVQSNATYQLQVNSASVPSYKMTMPEAYAMTVNSIGKGKCNHAITLDQYRKHFFVQCYRFNLPNSEEQRLASGLDTRSVSAMGSLLTQNVPTRNVYMFAECTSELRVGSGRAIEVIQ